MLKVSVLLVYCNCVHIGRGKCAVCWGSCCPLVNCTLSTLVRIGELNEDAEVSVYVLVCDL